MKRVILGLALASLSANALAANCPPYPYTLQNGQPADANQVMDNFNAIRNCTSRLGSAAWVDATAFQPSGQYVAPTTGQTVVVQPIGPVHFVKLKPAGTLSSLTLSFPVSAMDNQVIWVVSTAAITTVTPSGATFDGTALTTLAAGGSASFVYSANDGKFTRLQ